MLYMCVCVYVHACVCRMLPDGIAWHQSCDLVRLLGSNYWIYGKNSSNRLADIHAAAGVTLCLLVSVWLCHTTASKADVY